MIVPAYPGRVVPLEIFMARKFGMEVLGVKIWLREFFGFCLKPKRFVWVLIFAPIRSSLSLEIWSTPWVTPYIYYGILVLTNS